jgi:hypothetical protein
MEISELEEKQERNPKAFYKVDPKLTQSATAPRLYGSDATRAVNLAAALDALARRCKALTR